jgi:hypothetical protein
VVYFLQITIPSKILFGKIPKKLFAGDLHKDGLAFAFASLIEPCAEPFGEVFWGEAEAGFELAVGDGKSIVKVGGVGEVAHAELIKPIERAGAGFAADDDVHVEFLRVHGVEQGELKLAPTFQDEDSEVAKHAADQEVRGRLTEWARPTASSIQMKYQPMSV